MAKTVLLGKDKEKQLKEQKKIAKAKNKKKRRGLIRYFKDVWNDLNSATRADNAFILVMAIVTGLFDFGLGELFSLVIS